MSNQARQSIPALTQWLLVCTLVATAVACATSPVPGGGTYGLTITTKENSLMPEEGGEFTYGRFSRKFALNGGGGTRGVSEFREFHTLQLAWTTASGIERRETIDIAPLIERMQAERKIRRFEGLRTLRIEIDGEWLAIFYEIIPRQGYVAKKGARRKHSLYESTHN
ncbi:MAG: hypothetical protein U5R46_01625 [Gammaproteobacteria bacterium]|nr:hypothetical protein [Gammaproteobacteria bacterium]